MTLIFLILAVITLAGAVAAMTLRMLVHSVLALAIAFAGLAALYIQMGAQFVGLAQILVYVGAVVILIVFAILLTRDPTEIASAVAARRNPFWQAARSPPLFLHACLGGDVEHHAGPSPARRRLQ